MASQQSNDVESLLREVSDPICMIRIDVPYSALVVGDLRPCSAVRMSESIATRSPAHSMLLLQRITARMLDDLFGVADSDDDPAPADTTTAAAGDADRALTPLYARLIGQPAGGLSDSMRGE